MAHLKTRFIGRSFTNGKPDGYGFFLVRGRRIRVRGQDEFGRRFTKVHKIPSERKRLRLKAYRPEGMDAKMQMVPAMSGIGAVHFGILKDVSEIPQYLQPIKQGEYKV